MTDLTQFQQDIMTAAQLAGTPYNEAAIARVLEVYRPGFETQPTEFRTTTKPQEKRNVNFRYLQFDLEENVLEMAYDSGLLAPDDSPAQRIIAEAYARQPILGTGVDGGADIGLEKLWVCMGVGSLDRYLALPSIPPSVAETADFYARYNMLDKVGTLGTDLYANSMNVYGLTDPDYCTPDHCAGMIADLGFKVPSDEVLEACATTPTIALTYRWDKPGIQRICFYVAYPQPEMIPTDLHPMVLPYVNAVPTGGDARPMTIIGYTYGASGDYIKMETDYWNIGQAFHNALTTYAAVPEA